MSFIINRVFPRYRERVYNENNIREFELQCANRCQILTTGDFKIWLESEVEIELLKIFAAQKCNYRTSRDLTVYEIDQCIDKITQYIYSKYRSSYFTAVENTRMRNVIDGSEASEEDQLFEAEMVHLLQSLRNDVTVNEAPTNEMMSAALQNDIRSAMLFYDAMVSINSRREIMVPRRKFNIDLEEDKQDDKQDDKQEEKIIECFVCLENISNITCVKQNCSHECCATCLINTINADKRPEPLCAMCRTPIENLIVKTIELKNELNKLYN